MLPIWQLKSPGNHDGRELSEFSNRLNYITTKFVQDSQRILLVKNDISNVEDGIAALETKLTDAKGKLEALAHRVDDQELRSHGDNRHVLCLGGD